jgi:dTDP-4-dehydrorhamnose reductase
MGGGEKMNIAIIGRSGMLSSMLVKTLDADVLSRPQFDAIEPDLKLLEGYDYIINAAGVIKPYCSDIENAIRVNSLFPYMLPSNTIQIATDCVYSGSKGGFVE